MSGVPEFNTPYLNHYLQMVEDTESPRIFHIWSAIFAMSSALGRRCFLPFGTFDIFPNHYILLVGTPGTRKTTAANQGKRVLRNSTGVRFAPPDTGGQRQGIIVEMADTGDEEKEFLGSAELGARDNGLASLSDLEEITNDPEDEKLRFVDSADKHHLAVIASEFSRLVGQNNGSMLDFLGEMYDGEDIWYRTKQSKIQLKNCLINLLACTTPVHINNSLPPAAAGQGFLSRMILVYGAKKYKQVPRPQAPDVDLVMRVKDTLSDAYYNLAGAFEETPEARAFSESLYGYTLDITDSRFGYYNERRYTHLIKLAMCLCAARGSRVIVRDDYDESHRILRATERGMPDALGEFGMNPLAMLKQEILEQLRANQGPLTMEQIVAMFHRDARSHEIMEVVNDLVRMGQVNPSQARTGSRFLTAAFTRENTEDAMLKLLAEG
jgi:hypothetical protein